MGLGLLLFHQHKKHSRFGVSLPRYTIVTSWRFLMTETSLIIINPPPGDQQRIKSPALVFLLIPIIMPTCRARAHTPGSYPRPPSRLGSNWVQFVSCAAPLRSPSWGFNMFAHATVLSCERGARPGKSRHGAEVRLSRDTRANNKIASEKCVSWSRFIRFKWILIE